MAVNKRENRETFLLSDKTSFRTKEDYRGLRTNLDFSVLGSTAKVLAVTSSEKGEGKSTNAINIAYSYAELDKKVLLIDADCRLSSVVTKLRIPRASKLNGLTDVLVGKSSLSESIIKDNSDSIYVLPAGTLPPDPTKLLQSKRMGLLLNSLRKSFDYIIVDCPPITEVIDAVLFAQHVDGYILIVKHGSSNHKNIREMIEQLQYANAKILGFVYVNAPVNDHRNKKGNYYGDYYGYYKPSSK